MCGRVINYYQTPADPAFVRHMFDDTGLSDRDQKIAWSIRKKRGNTDLYADDFLMSQKSFNEAVGNIHRRLMSELIRLAIIGWKTEQKML